MPLHARNIVTGGIQFLRLYVLFLVIGLKIVDVDSVAGSEVNSVCFTFWASCQTEVPS